MCEDKGKEYFSCLRICNLVPADHIGAVGSLIDVLSLIFITSILCSNYLKKQIFSF